MACLTRVNALEFFWKCRWKSDMQTGEHCRILS